MFLLPLLGKLARDTAHQDPGLWASRGWPQSLQMQGLLEQQGQETPVTTTQTGVAIHVYPEAAPDTDLSLAAFLLVGILPEVGASGPLVLTT